MIALHLATRNPGKIREVNRVLDALPGGLHAVLPAGGMPDVEETGATFQANARLKAEALSRTLDGWVLADDSGLAVDALDGEPGVHSARYGESEHPDLDDAGRARLLLERLADVPEAQRTARFVCVLALARDGKVEAILDGICEGQISRTPRGGGGFGYDPVFVPAGEERTFGELPPEEKDHRSHRAQALAKLAEWFRRRHEAGGG
jgi:XTP/dITP diphosphohydrolase